MTGTVRCVVSAVGIAAIPLLTFDCATGRSLHEPIARTRSARSPVPQAVTLAMGPSGGSSNASASHALAFTIGSL